MLGFVPLSGPSESQRETRGGRHRVLHAAGAQVSYCRDAVSTDELTHGAARRRTPCLPTLVSLCALNRAVRPLERMSVAENPTWLRRGGVSGSEARGWAHPREPDRRGSMMSDDR